ncbi:MAG: VanW family protein [Candidatus Muiribacteriota bacterium]
MYRIKKRLIIFITLLFIIIGWFYLSPVRVEVNNEKKIFYNTRNLESFLNILEIQIENKELIFFNEEFDLKKVKKIKEFGEVEINKDRVKKKFNSIWVRFKSMFGVYSQIPLNIDLDKNTVMNSIENIFKKYKKDPFEADFLQKDGILKIIEGRPGLNLDYFFIYKNIVEALKNNQKEIFVEIEKIEPEKSLSNYVREHEFNHVLGKYKTEFEADNKKRVKNLKVAAEAIDNIVLKPGQEFSFNDFVGPRTREAGYVEAPVIINGRLEDGLAGGICQITSNLPDTIGTL